MTRTQFPPNRRALPSLILLAQIVAFGCASKVQLGEIGAGGNSSAGGAPAAGGATSSTSAGTAATTGGATSTFKRLANNAVTGIDVLLMIDNSSSMADKQATLAAAVPQLLGQLVQPACLDANGAPIAGQYALLGANPPCAQGTPEFNPVNNIHIGIVSSSLGDHGAQTIANGAVTRALCYPGAPTSYTDANGVPIMQLPDVNDMSHLMGTLARGAAAAADPTTTIANINSNQGFLAWGALNLQAPPSNTDLTTATKIFTDMVVATAEKGCGLEAQLESWFRFLIDPVPPIFPVQPPDANGTHRQGSDDVLLAQRAAFLRPDSLVAIVMLTDENDCSLRDTDVGYVAARTDMAILGGSPMCATNPNDKCCYSCTTTGPAGCPACANPAPMAVDDGPFQANLRCWQQKRRFGYEFLYPTSRYVVGLTNKTLCPDQDFGDMDCTCRQAQKIGANCNPGSRQMPNPLYSNVVGQLNDGKTNVVGYPNAMPRADNSNVLLAGIVGVPWQDISEPQSQAAGAALNYIPVSDARWTDPNGIWSTIYGDDSANIVPADVHMVESVVPRAGLPGPTAATNADTINGHEYTTAFEDLEYACTYRLPAPRACACTAGATDYASCKYKNPNDCCDLAYQADGRGGPGGTFNKPLCNGNSQESAKANPGLREIAVLHDYATSTVAVTPGNSVVASICPKDLTAGQESSPGYGYNPAASALVDLMKGKIKVSCLAAPLSVNSGGSVSCNVVEVVSADIAPAAGLNCASYCYSKGRTSPSVAAAADLKVAMQQSGLCDISSRPTCDTLCTCQLQQETGANLTICQNATDGSETTLPPGFCYVDPSQGAGNPALVSTCPMAQQRTLRFVGNNISTGVAVPLAGAYTFMSCQ